MPEKNAAVGAAGAVDVRKVLGAQETVTTTYAETIEIDPELLGRETIDILTRLRFHDHDTTYDVVGWNAATKSLICQKVS